MSGTQGISPPRRGRNLMALANKRTGESRRRSPWGGPWGSEQFFWVPPAATAFCLAALEETAS